MQNYKTLSVWIAAHQLTLEVYRVSKSFPKAEIFGLTSQFRRSTVSVPANIAEGCGRFTNADTARFFQIALGSLHETEYYITLSKELEFITEQEFKKLNQISNSTKAMLINLIKKVRTK